MSKNKNITLVGCGKMGSALLKGWLASDIQATFSVIDPHNIPFRGLDHFRDTAEASKTLAKTDLVIIAVKPQIMAEICNALNQHIQGDALILSIAAGQSIQNFENYFGPKQPIIRSMPNTPAAIGKGMTVAIANTNVTAQQQKLAQTLLESAGKLEWLTDEAMLDAVTALSGSGPAYLFHLIEILSKAGEKTGLPAETAKTLARQTIIGSAALAEQDKETSADILRKNVTSPGGTTEAALKILMDGRLQELFDEALKAATKRSLELNA